VDHSPRHVTPARWYVGAGVWFAVLGGFLLLLRYDVALMRWRYRAIHVPPEGWLRQVLLGFRDFGQVVPVVVALIIAATYDRRRKSIITTIFLAQLFAAGSYNAGKWLIARYRPYAAIEEVADLSSLTVGETWVGWRPGNPLFRCQSFPSGHAAAAFAFAGVLGWFYPRLRWMFWVLAVGCAASRCVDGAHWPSDCLAGAVIGYMTAWLTLRLVTASLSAERPGLASL